MSYLRKLGTAVLLVAAAMAIIGTGSAAAKQSVLCKVNETPCKSENRYTKGTEVVLESTGVLEVYAANGQKFFGCQEFSLEGEVAVAGGSSETAEIDLPSQALTPCTCDFTSLKADLKFNWISGTMNGAGTAEEFEISTFCPSIQFGCTFGGKVSEGITLTGGNPAVLTFNIEFLPRIGPAALCGGWVNVTGEFDITTPKPLYISTA